MTVNESFCQRISLHVISMFKLDTGISHIMLFLLKRSTLILTIALYSYITLMRLFFQETAEDLPSDSGARIPTHQCYLCGYRKVPRAQVAFCAA